MAVLLKAWAKDWLTTIAERGGAHGPGSSKSVKISGSEFSSLFTLADATSAVAEQLIGPRASFDPNPTRNAVVFEQSWEGSDALWIDAMAYSAGRPMERVVLVQKIKKRFLGRVRTIGPVVEVDPSRSLA